MHTICSSEWQMYPLPPPSLNTHRRSPTTIFLNLGIASHPTGGFVVSDCGNDRIRCVSLEGDVTTLAGSGVSGFADGPAHLAQFNKPYGIARHPSKIGAFVVCK